jgi:hypothetical protein
MQNILVQVGTAKMQRGLITVSLGHQHYEMANYCLGISTRHQIVCPMLTVPVFLQDSCINLP